MSTYKVLQDIEAEDKLLGPLSVRQFVYAGITAVCLGLCYFFATHGAAFLMVIPLPIAAICAFFAFPWGRDQPTEIWALAKIRFLIKPRKRIWDQSGAKELVTITAPKRVVTEYTNGLSQIEVRSRLHALANTIDSRGWAIKNANLNLYGQAPLTADPTSDRLIAPSSLPQPVESVDIQAADDILDEKNNAGAQRLDSMINKSASEHRERIMESLQGNGQTDQQAKQPVDNYWFLNQPAAPSNIPSDMVTFNTQVVTPGMPGDDTSSSLPAPAAAQDEAQIVAELEQHKQQMPGSSFYGHLHQIQPLSASPQQTQQPAPALATNTPQAPAQTAPLNNNSTPVAAPVTPATQAAILSLASNDDLDVATIAREAERKASQNEVVIKLH